MNLSHVEIWRLRWLETKIKEGHIAITKADKGGATLIINPNIVKLWTVEKLKTRNEVFQLEADSVY